jgi:hypothetical protein
VSISELVADAIEGGYAAALVKGVAVDGGALSLLPEGAICVEDSSAKKCRRSSAMSLAVK